MLARQAKPKRWNGSGWEKAIKENTELYGFLKDELDDYLKMKKEGEVEIG